MSLLRRLLRWLPHLRRCRCDLHRRLGEPKWLTSELWLQPRRNLRLRRDMWEEIHRLWEEK